MKNRPGTAPPLSPVYSWAQTALMVMLLIGLEILPALAAPPVNDDFDSATVVTEPLPFTDAIDTTEATTAPNDPDCAGNSPTVWYVFTTTQDMPKEEK
jgi:hypothetical protein